MKLADVKIGSIVGVVDSPGSRSHNNIDPRRFEVEAIVTTTKKTHDYWAHTTGTKNVKMVSGKFIDPPRKGFAYGLDRADKGVVMSIEARKIVGLWSDLEPGIVAKAEAETARQERVAALEARLKAVLGVKELDSYVQQQGTAYTFAHEELETILSLAEYGMTVDAY